MGQMIKWALSWLLKKAGLSMLGATGAWVLLFGALTVAGGAGYAGYRVADTIWKARQTQTLVRMAESMRDLDAANRTRERELIAKAAERRVVIREVIKNVPTYIDRDNCQLTPAGVQSVAEAAQRAFAATERIRDGPR